MLALVGDDGGAEPEAGRRIVGVRIVVGDRAADGAAMAHRRIADQAGELRERRQVLLHHRRVRDVDMPRHRADRRSSGPSARCRPVPSICDEIDDVVGDGQPQLHGRDQRMAAGEELRLLDACRAGPPPGAPSVGRWNVKLYIVVLLDSLRRLRAVAGCFLHARAHTAAGVAGMAMSSVPMRVGDGVDHGGRRRDRARLAAALDAERIGRAFRHRSCRP